jgi:metal-dependent hydrolase (beta-lactamase superfamily II)
MSEYVCITTLVEDTASGTGLSGEHGLSFWIEYGGQRVLFDTGQTCLLLKNARILGADNPYGVSVHRDEILTGCCAAE